MSCLAQESIARAPFAYSPSLSALGLEQMALYSDGGFDVRVMLVAQDLEVLEPVVEN